MQTVKHFSKLIYFSLTSNSVFQSVQNFFLTLSEDAAQMTTVLFIVT